MTPLNSDGTVAVDPEYFWRPLATCPKSVKVQLLGEGGVAVYGIYDGQDNFWKFWAPLPKLNKQLEK